MDLVFTVIAADEIVVAFSTKRSHGEKRIRNGRL